MKRVVLAIQLLVPAPAAAEKLEGLAAALVGGRER